MSASSLATSCGPSANRFSSEDGRRLVLHVARKLGWTLRRGTAERIGLIAALAGGGLAVAVVLALGLAFLLLS
jgi:hypothetical protein